MVSHGNIYSEILATLDYSLGKLWRVKFYANCKLGLKCFWQVGVLRFWVFFMLFVLSLLFCFLLNRFSFSVPFPFLSQDPSSEPPLFINPVPISWFLHRKLPQQIMGLIRIRQRSTHVSWYWTATVHCGRPRGTLIEIRHSPHSPYLPWASKLIEIRHSPHSPHLPW